MARVNYQGRRPLYALSSIDILRMTGHREHPSYVHTGHGMQIQEDAERHQYISINEHKNRLKSSCSYAPMQDFRMQKPKTHIYARLHGRFIGKEPVSAVHIVHAHSLRAA